MRKTVKTIGLNWPGLNSGLVENEGRVLALWVRRLTRHEVTFWVETRVPYVALTACYAQIPVLWAKINHSCS